MQRYGDIQIITAIKKFHALIKPNVNENLKKSQPNNLKTIPAIHIINTILVILGARGEDTVIMNVYLEGRGTEESQTQHITTINDCRKDNGNVPEALMPHERH